MKSKTTRHGLKRMTALLLAVVLCVGMVPTAFAAQQDSYHDPAENWQEANNRTNELDANATVTHETFNCKVCKQQTSFYRVPHPGIYQGWPDGHEPECEILGRHLCRWFRQGFHSGRRTGTGRLLHGLSLDQSRV